MSAESFSLNVFFSFSSRAGRSGPRLKSNSWPGADHVLFHLAWVHVPKPARVLGNGEPVCQQRIVSKLPALEEAVAAELFHGSHLGDRFLVPATPVMDAERLHAGLVESRNIAAQIVLVAPPR